MDRFINTQIEGWILEKVASNPHKFGGDECNALLMQQYLAEHYGVDLPLSAMKSLSTVARRKSEVLLKHPEFDKRVVHKPKTRKSNVGGEN